VIRRQVLLLDVAVVVVVDVTVVVVVIVVETVVVLAGAVTVRVGSLTVTCVLLFVVVGFSLAPAVTVEVVVLPPRPVATEMMNATARPATKATTAAIHIEARPCPLKLWPHDGQNWAPAGTSAPHSGQRRGSSDGS
jgi:hypothetical protein